MIDFLQGNISVFIFTTFFVFSVGLFGVIFYAKNFIKIMLSIELMLLASMLNLLFFSSVFHDRSAYIFVLFILSIAAAESAVGLSIIVSYFKKTGNISTSEAIKVGDKP